MAYNIVLQFTKKKKNFYFYIIINQNTTVKLSWNKHGSKHNENHRRKIFVLSYEILKLQTPETCVVAVFFSSPILIYWIPLTVLCSNHHGDSKKATFSTVSAENKWFGSINNIPSKFLIEVFKTAYLPLIRSLRNREKK